MNYPPVLTKKDFVRRYAANEFGNASPTWNTFQDWVDGEGWLKGSLFHIRNRVKSGKTWYDVPAVYLRGKWIEATALCGEGGLYISSMAPTERTVIQGEVQEGLWGLDLTYTRVRKPMRDALAEETKTVTGLMATMLLAGSMNDLSYAWLRYLLETYPNHVVEFSVYETCWGTVPGYNTVFWEIRAY